MEPRIILETGRLMLREMTMADLDYISSLLANPVVMQYYSAPLSKDESSNSNTMVSLLVK